MDHSVFNNGTECYAALHQNSLTSVRPCCMPSVRKLWPIATDGIARSVSVSHVHELCINSRTNQDAIWWLTRVGSKN